MSGQVDEGLVAVLERRCVEMTETAEARGGAGETGIPQIPLHYIRLHRMGFFTQHLPFPLQGHLVHLKTHSSFLKALYCLLTAHLCEGLRTVA